MLPFTLTGKKVSENLRYSTVAVELWRLIRSLPRRKKFWKDYVRLNIYIKSFRKLSSPLHEVSSIEIISLIDTITLIIEVEVS